MKKNSVELLAPARDLDCGKAAVDHGADAVYIGGPAFSARGAAANSLEDISALVDYAHGFHVKVYVAVNTLLRDEEIDEAVSLIHACHAMAADAVIIQDFGLLECDLPPIALHASTQMDNRSVEKVRFLEALGFQQVVLARELNLEQIARIAEETSVALECFVHGALCVSYSGRCYISEVMAGRSANRGECAQFCRHLYSLKDERGNSLGRDAYYLSLHDLCQIDNLEELLAAGVRSFKIEGRLKGSDYVKNITALYRQKIDAVLERLPHLCKSSSGNVTPSFSPGAEKTFHRGKTEYFLHDGRNRVGNPVSPKSTGEFLGEVVRMRGRAIEIDTRKALRNGDGLCYADGGGLLKGIRVNRVDGCNVYPARNLTVAPGTKVYRNHDSNFVEEVSRSAHCRKISVDVLLSEGDGELRMEVTDEDSIVSSCRLPVHFQEAHKPQATLRAMEKQVRQSGDTIFTVDGVELDISPHHYYPGREVKALRRAGLEEHLRVRVEQARPEDVSRRKTPLSWPDSSPYMGVDICNARAESFVLRHGGTVVRDVSPQDLMRCKYCIRNQLDICPAGKGSPHGKNAAPLQLSDQVSTFTVLFDCRRCEMVVRKKR